MKYRGFILILLILMINSCNSKEEKSVYLAGWEVEFDSKDDCNKFVQTQAIDKKTAYSIWSSIELVFINDSLVKAYNIEDGRKTERGLSSEEKGFLYPDVKPHDIYQFIQTNRAKSYLGGEPPADFSIPKFEFNAPFQYLGKFSKDDDAFHWPPFDLHLIAPIYLNIDKVYLDYSDPNSPKVINLEDLKITDTEYDELKPDSEIIFKKVPFKAEKSNDFGYYAMGHSGVPNWIQFPEIPSCPKSNKTMRFLCQLRSDVGVITSRTNVNPKDDWCKKYFEQMNFWGDGDLFVFFDPESKIVCLFIQNT